MALPAGVSIRSDSINDFCKQLNAVHKECKPEQLRTPLMQTFMEFGYIIQRSRLVQAMTGGPAAAPAAGTDVKAAAVVPVAGFASAAYAAAIGITALPDSKHSASQTAPGCVYDERSTRMVAGDGRVRFAIVVLTRFSFHHFALAHTKVMCCHRIDSG